MSAKTTEATSGKSVVNSDKNSFSPVLAGAMGMVAGAAVRMFLDSKTRGQLVKVIEKAIDQARLTGESSRQVAEETVSKLAEAKDEIIETIEGKAESVTKAARKTRN